MDFKRPLDEGPLPLVHEFTLNTPFTGMRKKDR